MNHDFFLKIYGHIFTSVNIVRTLILDLNLVNHTLILDSNLVKAFYNTIQNSKEK